MGEEKRSVVDDDDDERGRRFGSHETRANRGTTVRRDILPAGSDDLRDGNLN